MISLKDFQTMMIQKGTFLLNTLEAFHNNYSQWNKEMLQISNNNMWEGVLKVIYVKSGPKGF
jgi:hypothetical protein